jgi:hypothetical protein
VSSLSFRLLFRIAGLCGLASLFLLPATAQTRTLPTSTPRNMAQFVRFIQARHKAPFERDGAELPAGGRAALLRNLARMANPNLAALTGASLGGNVRVNRDRNPWPKAETASALDPSGKVFVVMSNDFRENFDHQFFHVSTNGGLSFTDDSLVGGADPITGFVPLTFQSDPGVAIDSKGNAYFSTISGNSIFDFDNGYINLDSEVETVQGFASGRYASLLPTPVDDQPCSGTFDVFNCPAQLDKPLITVDNVPGSPHNGTVYVYYTLFCNGTGEKGDEPCTDGDATVPAFSSAILEVHSAGGGTPFTAPALVSADLSQEQFSSMVIDSHGTPHIFFDDFSNDSFVRMFESTLTGGVWTRSANPVAEFTFFGLNNLNWGFRDNGTRAPGCDIHGDTAYCAFSANQVAGAPLEGTPSVYLAVVDTQSGKSSLHRVNNDPFNNSKHHFFPWAAATPDGSVYVGWYDDRNDPFNTRVQYFVGKSSNGGKTFPMQKAVSTAAFNPCVGFPGCGFFGDYTQLTAGSDGVVHALWSDTRDGVSMQMFTQAISW